MMWICGYVDMYIYTYIYLYLYIYGRLFCPAARRQAVVCKQAGRQAGRQAAGRRARRGRIRITSSAAINYPHIYMSVCTKSPSQLRRHHHQQRRTIRPRACAVMSRDERDDRRAVPRPQRVSCAPVAFYGCQRMATATRPHASTSPSALNQVQPVTCIFNNFLILHPGPSAIGSLFASYAIAISPITPDLFPGVRIPARASYSRRSGHRPPLRPGPRAGTSRPATTRLSQFRHNARRKWLQSANKTCF